MVRRVTVHDFLPEVRGMNPTGDSTVECAATGGAKSRSSSVVVLGPGVMSTLVNVKGPSPSLLTTRSRMAAETTVSEVIGTRPTPMKEVMVARGTPPEAARVSSCTSPLAKTRSTPLIGPGCGGVTLSSSSVLEIAGTSEGALRNAKTGLSST